MSEKQEVFWRIYRLLLSFGIGWTGGQWIFNSSEFYARWFALLVFFYFQALAIMFWDELRAKSR